MTDRVQTFFSVFAQPEHHFCFRGDDHDTGLVDRSQAEEQVIPCAQLIRSGGLLEYYNCKKEKQGLISITQIDAFTCCVQTWFIHKRNKQCSGFTSFHTNQFCLVAYGEVRGPGRKRRIWKALSVTPYHPFESIDASIAWNSKSSDQSRRPGFRRFQTNQFRLIGYCAVHGKNRRRWEWRSWQHAFGVTFPSIWVNSCLNRLEVKSSFLWLY